MRPIIHATDEKHDIRPDMTIREAVEWYKDFAQLGAPLTGEESEYVNGRWGYIMGMIAEAQGVPAVWVSYLAAELAQTELKLLDTAIIEAADSITSGGAENFAEES